MTRPQLRYVLVVSCVGHGSVHAEFVALYLVELVSGIWILTGSHHCRSNVQILVEVLPADFTWTHTGIRLFKSNINIGYILLVIKITTVLL